MTPDLEEALARLRLEFIEMAREWLDEIDTAIDDIYNHRGDRGEQFVDLQRHIHTIKGSAGSHGLKLVSLICHRLEDYLESTRRLEHEQWLEVQRFIDQIRAAMDSGSDPAGSEQEKIMAGLPSSATRQLTTGFSDQERRQVVVLVVMPAGLQRKMVGTELASCGFDISFAKNPLEAINLAVTLKPQVVLSDQEFDTISGADLAGIFALIKTTRDCHFAVITSYDEMTGELALLPHKVKILKKDKQFMESLTEYLMGIGLFGEI